MRKNKSRWFKVVTIVTVLASLAYVAQPAFALPKDSVFITYYSDASKKTIVGYYDVYCDGQIEKSGQQTAYENYVSEAC